MTRNWRQKAEFGDFQTPNSLAEEACNLLKSLGASPDSIVEPTCGKGSFLRSAIASFPHCHNRLGFEVNQEYVRTAREETQAEVICKDFFLNDWRKTLDRLVGQILVVGNPPWVTNSAVGTLGGKNLPTKTNFQQFRGLDAITGKSNFDISEWMLVHLLERLSGRDAVLAMLCKTVVARKVLHQAWTRRLHIESSSIYRIDAPRHFGASVDACFLICFLKKGVDSEECLVYSDLHSTIPETTIALRQGRIVADSKLFKTYGHLLGKSPIKWRSGIKHDCSRVIELLPKGGGDFENQFGRVVNLESTHLYPMLKSSELMRSDPKPSRLMLVTQRSVGEDTLKIRCESPKTWEYLESYRHLFDGRGSSIYRNRPRFSMFGVGPYSFAPWKVAISGFYKHLQFRCVGPEDGKPVVLDDTCYFLPCESRKDAKVLYNVLNSKSAVGFFRSLIFWDSKRPITAQILSSINLMNLAEELDISLPHWSDYPQSLPLFD